VWLGNCTYAEAFRYDQLLTLLRASSSSTRYLPTKTTALLLGLVLGLPTQSKIGTAPAQIEALCAQFEVPLNPLDSSAGTVALSIARIPSRRQSSHTDAVTFLAGGPGQSAIETYPGVAFAFRHINRDRDVVLVDQRGTGQSLPLDCDESTDGSSLDANLSLQDDPQKIAQQAAECLAQLPADPRFFTTSIAVQDLENLRQQLGITQWNLYGISYGTRVAAHYLRRYPDAVRSVVLDAVVPPQISLGPDIAQLAQQSLDHIFARCEADAGCGEAFGNLSDDTLDLIENLQNTPRTLTYEDIATGKRKTRSFTHNDLAITLRLMSYSSQTAAILPSMLFEAIDNDNLAPLARQADMLSTSLSGSLASGMHHAIICTEDAPFFTDELARSENTVSYMGSNVLSAVAATCDQWPAGVMDDDFKEPLVSGIPALILSGAADPITPPAYGDLLAETLTRSRHIVNEAQGHMQAPFGCMPSLMAQFIDTPDPDLLDVECLERLRPTPFFVDANGPLP